MKAFLQTSLYTLIVVLLLVNMSYAQEYDDVYFRKSDREKLKELRAKEAPTYGKGSYLYDEIEKIEGGDDDEGMLDKYNELNEDLELDEDSPTIEEKHYYYSNPNSRAYNDYRYDDPFWNDPFYYQGTIYDPYRSAYYQPSWSVSLSFGNRWNRSRWNNRYWNSYGYGYGYYDSWRNSSWYYDSYWCPPIYSNRSNVIVYSNRSGRYNGTYRGRRSSRNSSYSYRGRNPERSGRITTDGKGNNGGRSGRYSDGQNSGRRYNNANSSSQRRSSSTYSGSRRTNTRSYSSGSRSNTRSSSGSNSYRSGSRSSSNSGLRSTGSRTRSSSSSRSKSGTSSRSSRSKKNN